MAARQTRPECKPCLATKPQPAATKPSLMITSDGEAERLWKHVLIGTCTCHKIIEQYAEAEMPGMPVEQITRLRDQLTRLLETHADHADPDPAHEALPVLEADGDPAGDD